MVASLPSKGARPEICMPSAARTCCELSPARSRTHGIKRARMMSWSTSLAKPDLTSTCCANLGLVVLEEVDESHDKLVTDHILTHSRSQLDKVIRYHVSYPPALVLNGAADGWQQVVLGFVVAERLCNGDEILYCQQTDRVLVVRRKFAVERNDIRDDELLGQVLGKRSKITSGGSSNHGGIIVAEGGEHLSKFIFCSWFGFGVDCGEEGSGAGSRCEPVTTGKSFQKWDVVFFDLCFRENFGDLDDGFGSLCYDERPF